MRDVECQHDEDAATNRARLRKEVFCRHCFTLSDGGDTHTTSSSSMGGHCAPPSPTGNTPHQARSTALTTRCLGASPIATPEQTQRRRCSRSRMKGQAAPTTTCRTIPSARPAARRCWRLPWTRVRQRSWHHPHSHLDTLPGHTQDPEVRPSTGRQAATSSPTRARNT